MKKVIFTFGRFCPPSIGHGKLFNFMKDLSSEDSSDMMIFVSHTYDNTNNPLKYNEKIRILNASYPSYRNFIVKCKCKTIFDVLSYLISQDYLDITLVVGQDRLKQFNDIIDVDTINKKNCSNVKKIIVLSAGYRNGDKSDREESISSTRLRDCVRSGDFNRFRTGVSPELSEQQCRILFNLLGKRLEINRKEGMCMEENTKHGFDPAGNKSRMWQTFRQWFYIQENDMMNRPDSDFLVVDKKGGYRYLPVKVDGKPDHILMGAAYNLLTHGFYSRRYTGPKKEEALKKLELLYKKEKMKLPL